MPEDLEALERARLEALVAGDRVRMDALHAPDYELITPGGDPFSRSEYLDSLASGELHYTVFRPVSPVRVRQTEDAAIVRYVVHIEIDFGDGHDGGRFWHTDYWERRDGAWQAVWSQATRIQGPEPTDSATQAT